MPKLLDRLSFRRKAREPSAAKTVQTRVRQAPDAVKTSLLALGQSRKAPVAPAVLLATGVGVAFWWWTQWARGTAESEAAAKEKD